MDTIEFNVYEVKNDNIKSKFFDVDVILNGKKIPHNTLNVYEVLAVGESEFAEFDLFTCTCGVSGCAGFNSYVKHSKFNQKVQWLIPRNDGYKPEKFFYEFSQPEFEQVMLDMKSRVIAFSKQKVYSMSEFDYYTDTSYRKPKQINISACINKYKENFALEYQHQLFCKANMPFLDNLYFEYEGAKTSFAYLPHEFVKKIMNEWPAEKGPINSFYWKRVAFACHALNNYVLNGDMTDFLKIEKRQYQDKFSIVSTMFFKKENQSVFFHDVIESSKLKVYTKA